MDGWKARLAATGNERDAKVRPMTVQQVVEQNLYGKALLSPPGNWGGWELDHANPKADPEAYKNIEGVLLTHPFNRIYTVASPLTLDAFRAPSGLAVIRHYSLNENMMFDRQDKPKLGYFCADMERAGPYCMMGEAMAMANGDPTHIGYLRGRNFSRGFPQYVRNFNSAFLSLPALPSLQLKDASSDGQVVVRAISTANHGTYLAIINTAMTDKSAVRVKLPGAGQVSDAASGEAIPADNGSIQLNLYPFQMRALRIR